MYAIHILANFILFLILGTVGLVLLSLVLEGLGEWSWWVVLLMSLILLVL